MKKQHQGKIIIRSITTLAAVTGAGTPLPADPIGIGTGPRIAPGTIIVLPPELAGTPLPAFPAP
jgi:hypothetical protein